MTIDYSVYRRSDCGEMAALLGEVFSERDPPAVATGLTSADFEHFVRLLCPKAAEEGLSIVARARETGEMVGALLAEDSASIMPEEWKREPEVRSDLRHPRTTGRRVPQG
jgi:hypothetical protein